MTIYFGTAFTGKHKDGLLSFLKESRTPTRHAMALHSTHFVLGLERRQQRRADGDSVHHGAELEDDRLLLQALGKLRELVRFHGGLIDAGRLVGGLRGGGVLSVGGLTEIESVF